MARNVNREFSCPVLAEKTVWIKPSKVDILFTTSYNRYVGNLRLSVGWGKNRLAARCGPGFPWLGGYAFGLVRNRTADRQTAFTIKL